METLSTYNNLVRDMESSRKEPLKFIEDVTNKADEVQKRVLREILSDSANTEYLQRYGLAERTDPENFKKLIPIISYEDIKEDINRIINGDNSQILCGNPISQFYTSSGTTAKGGESKLIPTVKDEMARNEIWASLLMPIMNQYAPGLDKGKGMYFMFVKPEARTPGGLLVGSILTRICKSSNFKNKCQDPLYNCTSPLEAILCEDSYQSMYSQLLCGLYQNKEVLRLGSIFAHTFVGVIRFLQKHWTLLCNDIRDGTIDARITSPSVREAVQKVVVKPNPELAEFIKTECSRDSSWRGILTRLWPNAKYVESVVTGSMSQYIPILDHYSNGLPISSSLYASSECSFGLNLEPLSSREVSYLLLPTMAYFEFMPIERSDTDLIKEQRDLVDLVDVKLGQEYEIVVTTYAGLYRYRVGDILRVSGFKNKAPQFTFVSRKNVFLSIDYDKTTDIELQDAIKKAVDHLIPFSAFLDEYTCYADTSTLPGHYVLYWELQYTDCTTKIPPSIFENCCLTIEESINIVYRQLRNSGNTIGPLEIKIVKDGTFEKLMNLAVSRGAAISQYKTPRCVKDPTIVDLLNSRVVSNYFSPKAPKCLPGNAWYDDRQNGNEGDTKLASV